MKPAIKYNDPEWWFWAAITLGLVLGLFGLGWGYWLAAIVSAVNLAVYAIADGGLSGMRAQVRLVWLGLVALAWLVPGLGWLFYLLVLGMVMVLVFDRCGIALVLGKMPWNKPAAP